MGFFERGVCSPDRGCGLTSGIHFRLLKICASSKNSTSTIFFCSISAFKGLEKDFIVITDIDNLSKEWWRSVLYVGMSRARVGLILLLNNKERSTYDTYLKDWIRNDQSNTNSTELVYDQ